MTIERIVVIGASSGGVDAIRTLAGSLPREFAAPICVVVHTAPQSPGVLARIIDAAGPLPAEMATDGRRIEPGRIYVAPPDHHLLTEPGRLRLSRGPREHRFRPAVDPLFRSAAQVYGPRTIGVILSGNLDDGTAGLWTIKQLGGLALVQDPADAPYPGMPSSAMRHVRVDHCLGVHEIGPVLTRLVTLSVHAGSGEADRAVEVEVKIAKGMDSHQAGIDELGRPSPFACPDCHGVLRELIDEGRVRYRCHTGHAYSAASLLAAQNDGIEAAYWHLIRELEEVEIFLRSSVELEPDAEAAARLAALADSAGLQAGTLRDLVTRRERLSLLPGDNGNAS